MDNGSNSEQGSTGVDRTPDVQGHQAKDFAHQDEDAPIQPVVSGPVTIDLFSVIRRSNESDERRHDQVKRSLDLNRPMERRSPVLRPRRSTQSFRSIQPIRSFPNGQRISTEGRLPRINSQAARSDGTASLHSVGISPNKDPVNVNSLSQWVIRHHREGIIVPTYRAKRKLGLKGFGIKKALSPKKQDANPQDDEEKAERIWERPDMDQSFRVSLAEMQRMRLRKLQCKLVKHAADIRKAGEEPDGWEDDLEEYIRAIQDYYYMIQQAKSPRDPFLITGERAIDDFVIRATLGNDIEDGNFGEPIPVLGTWENDSQPIGGTRTATIAEKGAQEFRDKVVMATVGGFFLIAPMWFMVLRNDLYTSLVSTTAFVAAFGIIMAWNLDKPKEVIAGTAAYAAVLVVFVGTGSTT